MVEITDESCRAFDSVPPSDPGVLHRFVVGSDPAPRPLTGPELGRLGDPFARLLLARGTFPRTGEQLVEGIKERVRKGDPLRTQRSFLVGEGSQVAPGNPTVDATLRFVVTLGRGPDGPDVFLSAGDPKQAGGIEVMAWDRRAGGFNFYRSAGPSAMWMLAGNSRDALRDASRGKGPFESHPSGALLMKELKTPWVNWHSPAAGIPATAFRKDDARRRHAWFTERDPGGALAFEAEAARPAIDRWARVRFRRLRRQGGAVANPRRIMRQILDTPTANLTSTHVGARALAPDSELDLPATFFVDADGLSGVLGLAPPPSFTVSGRIYARTLERFDVRLEDGRGFVQPGDTHFCFVVPERAFEDQAVLREVVALGLVTPRLAACLLMVDPWNPVFSPRRLALLRHVPATAEVADGGSAFSAAMARAILQAAETAPEDAPEAEFARRWAVGSRFAGPFNRLLRGYYEAVEERLRTQAGFDAYFELAETRRRAFAAMPIAEFPLLLPKTNVEDARRRMTRDGAVTKG